MFIEHFLTGLATGLGYLVIIVVVGVLSWRLGIKAYRKFMRKFPLDLLSGIGNSSRSSIPKQVSCSNCGAPIFETYKYCPFCGRKQKEEA